MNLGNIIGKVESNSDKLGMILGFATGSPSGWADVTDSLQRLLAGQVHMPDLQNTFGAWAAEPYGRSGILVGIGGYILKEINVFPQLNRIGTVMEKAGFGYAIGSLLNKILLSSTHSGEFRGNINAGSGGSNTGYGY